MIYNMRRDGDAQIRDVLSTRGTMESDEFLQRDEELDFSTDEEDELDAELKRILQQELKEETELLGLNDLYGYNNNNYPTLTDKFNDEMSVYSFTYTE